MLTNGFWGQLPAEAAHLIETHVSYTDYKRHELVYRTGDLPKGIYILKSGLVGLVSTSSKGSEHLLRLFKPHDFFGHRALLAGEKYHANAICLEPSQIALVPTDIVESILKKFPETQRILIRTLAKELGLAEQQRIRVTDQEVLQRIAAALIYLKEIHPDHSWTRSEIAQFCASTAPTVIRALAELESQGLISQNGRQIDILDRTTLLTMAN